jgi:hypothetical protein
VGRASGIKSEEFWVHTQKGEKTKRRLKSQVILAKQMHEISIYSSTSTRAYN